MFQPIADLIKLHVQGRPDAGNRGPGWCSWPYPLSMVGAGDAHAGGGALRQRTRRLANLNVGVLYILAVTSITSIAIFMAGWSSNNRFALFGAARGVAVLISYEVPVVVSLLGVVMLSGSMSLS